jgi:hypothetical protein
VVGGVRLALHEARVTIHEGVAHTEIEEEFRNDTNQILEGKLLFPLPPEATLDRLALWVGKDLVEGEVVEKNRADRIFRGIVDDSVRPRDPALLDVVAGGKLSLRIYPIPARGSRRVLLAYDQVLRRAGGRLSYVHHLSLGSDRATPIEQLRVTVNGETRLDQRDVVPSSDVIVPIDEEPPALAFGTAPARRPSSSESAVIARRVVAAPEGASSFQGDVVLALDVSEGQSAASLAAQMHLAAAVIERLLPGETFALLACDAACASYPAAGRASPTPGALDEARSFLAALEVGGASDPAGALVEASRRLDAARPGQIVLLSDGTATAGELSVAGALAHAATHTSSFDLRIIGAGRSVDDRSLAGLARGLGATYDRLASGGALADRVIALAESRREPVDRSPELLLPAGLIDPEPALPTPTRAGEELIVLARAAGPVEGAVVTSASIPRLWAREQIARLEQRDDEEASAQITALSVRHHVLARTTSLLVLENDRMFAEFGIPRTTLRGPALFGDAPLLPGTHVARAPQVRMGMTIVSGRLPPEAIQRIVRLNFGRFRGCYDRGLLRNPALTGRVLTRFVINRNGEVASVADGGSDLPDSAVVSCVVKSFAGLSFPQPEGGIVTVEYPITFRPLEPGPPPAGRPAPPPRQRRLRQLRPRLAAALQFGLEPSSPRAGAAPPAHRPALARRRPLARPSPCPAPRGPQARARADDAAGAPRARPRAAGGRPQGGCLRRRGHAGRPRSRPPRGPRGARRGGRGAGPPRGGHAGHGGRVRAGPAIGGPPPDGGAGGPRPRRSDAGLCPPPLAGRALAEGVRARGRGLPHRPRPDAGRSAGGRRLRGPRFLRRSDLRLAGRDHPHGARPVALDHGQRRRFGRHGPAASGDLPHPDRDRRAPGRSDRARPRRSLHRAPVRRGQPPHRGRLPRHDTGDDAAAAGAVVERPSRYSRRIPCE